MTTALGVQGWLELLLDASPGRRGWSAMGSKAICSGRDMSMGLSLGLESVSIPRGIAERLRVEAARLGLSLEEYLVELALQSLDPLERAQEYIKASRELLERAREEAEMGEVRQAAEKLWGSASLAIKAFAAWREGRRLTSHGELWEYRRVVERELGDWVYDAWMAANGMHTCFHEGWCNAEDVKRALERVEKLVHEVARRLGS